MGVSYGFYNSDKGDRRYDAIQLSSIFDGIIRDGVLQHVGTAMMVKATEPEEMAVHVGIGRAWFNHTWTLNDSLLLLEIDISEVILDRIDAVVIDVDARETHRENTIRVVKGEAAAEPVKPELLKEEERWQYPLAYIRVNAGAKTIRQADITNCVGTSECPFVTAPLEKMEIDDLVAQWKDQWLAFYEAETTGMEKMVERFRKQFADAYIEESTYMRETNTVFEQEWERWFEGIKDVLISTENGQLLLEVEKLLHDMYDVATERDIDHIVRDTYVELENEGGLFEKASNEDIDNIIGGSYQDTGEPTESLDQIT